MNFNGNDRLVVFADDDNNGTFGAADRIVDAFGQTAVAPATEIWKDLVYRRCNLTPYDGFKLSFSILFNHPAIDSTGTSVTVDFAEHSYTREVARARTFGFMQDVEFMRANGLGLGGSLDNAIVMDEYRVLNADGLRYADEFVKHKVLDAIGDLYLAGHPLLAAYSAYKAGHALNNQILRVLLEDRTAWEIVTFEEEASTPPAVARLFDLALN